MRLITPAFGKEAIMLHIIIIRGGGGGGGGRRESPPSPPFFGPASVNWGC